MFYSLNKFNKCSEPPMDQHNKFLFSSGYRYTEIIAIIISLLCKYLCLHWDWETKHKCSLAFNWKKSPLFQLLPKQDDNEYMRQIIPPPVPILVHCVAAVLLEDWIHWLAGRQEEEILQTIMHWQIYDSMWLLRWLDIQQTN